jgi:hypothetical protein
MLRRRQILLIGLLSFITSNARSQDTPKLFILPKGITSPQLGFAPRAKKHDFSLEGWLVANGALVLRSTYKELFETLGPNAAPGDGTTTFGLPAFPTEYHAGSPIRGWAICPFENLGLIAELAQFSVDSNI